MTKVEKKHRYLMATTRAMRCWFLSDKSVITVRVKFVRYSVPHVHYCVPCSGPLHRVVMTGAPWNELTASGGLCTSQPILHTEGLQSV